MQFAKNVVFLLAIKNKYVRNNQAKRCGYSSGVERNLAKVDVVGSNPIARSNFLVNSNTNVLFDEIEKEMMVSSLFFV